MNFDQKSQNDMLKNATNQVRLVNRMTTDLILPKIKNLKARKRKNKFLKIARIRNRSASNESQVDSDQNYLTDLDQNFSCEYPYEPQKN